ncbi:MAG: DUF192 domain-containing protein [Nitrospirae bacterium]|nr:DUF192 domain-containing protein [Nitrospirota bacterium]
MALDKKNLKKGAFLLFALVTLGIAMPLMMGNQDINYFMVELPNGKQILAQVAESPEKQVVGLFFAKKLPPDGAMLFIYEDEDSHRLWTKNSHFPIDMIWMDRDRKILHVEEAAPPCATDPCPTYGPKEPEALYVMQAAAGFAKSNSLQPGMSMTFRLVQRK